MPSVRPQGQALPTSGSMLLYTGILQRQRPRRRALHACTQETQHAKMYKLLSKPCADEKYAQLTEILKVANVQKMYYKDAAKQVTASLYHSKKTALKTQSVPVATSDP